MAELPADLQTSIGRLAPELGAQFSDALQPVADELGARELAVLDRLVNGINSGASAQELNAFVRLLPVTVSRAVQPVIEPITA